MMESNTIHKIKEIVTVARKDLRKVLCLNNIMPAPAPYAPPITASPRSKASDNLQQL